MPWITELEGPGGKRKYRVGSFRNGRRKFKTFYNEKEAKAFAKTLGNLLLNKEYNFPGADGKVIPTFKVAAEAWFATRETNCKPSTIENYRYLLDNHVLPVFGELRLDEIRREDIEEFVSGKKKAGMAARSIRLMLAAMRPVFKRAIKDGILTANPASEPAELIKTGGKRQVEVFTGPEVRHILAVAKEHLPRFYPFLFTAFRTGMRQGELVALEWASIDGRGKFIEVRRNCWKGTFGTTKSGKARKVDMSDQLATVLTEHRKALAAAALKAGKPMPELAFPSTTFTTRGASHIRRDFHAVLKKAGMRRIRFHDVRHTFASLLIANRESLAYIKEQMGHSSIQITVDIYGHLVPGSNRQAVNCLDDHASGDGTSNRVATGGFVEAVANA